MAPSPLLGPCLTGMCFSLLAVQPSLPPMSPSTLDQPLTLLFLSGSVFPLLRFGQVPPSPSEHLHQPCKQVSQKRGAVPCASVGGSAEAEDPRGFAVRKAVWTCWVDQKGEMLMG